MAEISLYLDKRSEKKDGTFPIKIIVYHNNKNNRYGMKKKISVNQQEWDKIHSKNLKNVELISIKKYIEEEKGRADKIIKALDSEFTFEIFRSLYLEDRLPAKKGNQNKIWDMWENLIGELKKDKQIGLATNHQCSLKSFRSYSPELTFKNITPVFLKNYENWMINDNKSITTVSMYVRCLRRIFNIAKGKKIITEEMYPFGSRAEGKYEVPVGKNVKKAMNIDFLKVLKNAECKTEGEQFAKDMWFFSFYCNGMNMVDIFSLKYKNIKDDFFYFYQQKTSRTQKNKQNIEVYITDEISEIINRWGNEDRSSNNYIFNVFTRLMSPEEQFLSKRRVIRSINGYMKRLCKRNNIDIEISTYFARHSWATLLKNSGTTTEEISEGLGHSNLRTTKDYLDSFPQDHKKETAKKLSTLLS